MYTIILSISILLTLLSTASAVPIGGYNITTREPFTCGVDVSHAHPSFLTALKALHANESSPSKLNTRAASKYTQITVQTYFHIVTPLSPNLTSSYPPITSLMVADQFTVLNAAYKPYNIHFVLANTTHHYNDTWALASDTNALTDLKAATRYGTYAALNLWFHTALPSGMLGTCTLPAQLGSDPANYVQDGCNIAGQSMPGGSIGDYNMGYTAVHEVGHFLGLLHTFEGYSCSGPGDYVTDSPVESVATQGCPSTPPKDSCPQLAGVDPIQNYMDYSTDACYRSFTIGQVQRIDAVWKQFRAGK